MGTIPPDRRAIALLLRQPAVAQHPDLPPGWRDAPLPEVGLLAQLVDLACTRPDIPPAALIDRWEDPEVRRHLSAVQALRLDLIEEDIPAHFVGALRRLAELARRAEVERLLRKNDLTSLTDEEKTRLREIWRDRQAADETDACLAGWPTVRYSVRFCAAASRGYFSSTPSAPWTTNSSRKFVS